MSIAHMLRVTIVTLLWIHNSEGHGRLEKPAQRSSLWRFGKSDIVNKNDNALYCGGKIIQWRQNGGRCGLCGDSASAVRHNEAGGKYANDVIAEHYVAGEVIETVVRITANHLGFFEFRLCVRNDTRTKLTPGCLEENLLEIVESDKSRKTRHYIHRKLGRLTLKLQLPAKVTCKYCVLQWKYVTGADWGGDPVTDEFGLDMSEDQETFINCADIAIHARVSDTKSSSIATVSATMSVLSSSTSVPTTKTTTVSKVTETGP